MSSENLGVSSASGLAIVLALSLVHRDNRSLPICARPAWKTGVWQDKDPVIEECMRLRAGRCEAIVNLQSLSSRATQGDHWYAKAPCKAWCPGELFHVANPTTQVSTPRSASTQTG